MGPPSDSSSPCTFLPGIPMMLLSAQLNTVTSSSSSSADVSSSRLHRHFLHNRRLNIKMVGVTWCFKMSWDSDPKLLLQFVKIWTRWPVLHWRIFFPSLFATRFVSPCWPNDRMQVFGTRALALFLRLGSSAHLYIRFAAVYKCIQQRSKKRC